MCCSYLEGYVVCGSDLMRCLAVDLPRTNSLRNVNQLRLRMSRRTVSRFIELNDNAMVRT